MADLSAVFMVGLPTVRLAGLPAVFMAEWRGVLHKSGCCEKEGKPIIIRDADGAPQAIPWHHLVSPIHFANVGT